MSAWAMFFRTGPFSLKYSVICLEASGFGRHALLDLGGEGLLLERLASRGSARGASRPEATSAWKSSRTGP